MFASSHRKTVTKDFSTIGQQPQELSLVTQLSQFAWTKKILTFVDKQVT